MGRKRAESSEIEERLEELFLRLKQKGYNQQKLADALGLSQGHVSKLLQGKHQPSASLWLEMHRLAGSRAEY